VADRSKRSVLPMDERDLVLLSKPCLSFFLNGSDSEGVMERYSDRAFVFKLPFNLSMKPFNPRQGRSQSHKAAEIVFLSIVGFIGK